MSAVTEYHLILTIDPIPKSTWGINLHNLMSKQNWDNLRRNVYRQYNFRCGICGASAPLSCHEIWKFDDINNIQKLSGLIALCEMCHGVKHFGRSLAVDKTNYLLALINHFRIVNECSKEVFDIHEVEVRQEIQKRSKIPYRIDFGLLTPSTNIKNANKKI